MNVSLQRMLLISLALLGSLIVGACAYTQHPKFGQSPENAKLAIIEQSPHYANGEFRNLAPTPMFSEDTSRASILMSFLFSRPERLTPAAAIPSIKTDLKALDPQADVIVWLGHSSYFVQLGGKRILIDPVFSANAAPFPYANVAFEGTSIYTAEDMPAIDYLLITHDHWDHLDYSSVKALEPKVRQVIGGLGIGAYFEYWDYPKSKIHEADWFEVLRFEDRFAVHVLPARHYSGRFLTRNKTLWAGFALETPARRIFFSGDSGYGPHFYEIGQRLGGFDLAVLDSGQYDERWPLLHMFPEEAVQAADDLRAKALLPGHVGRFKLARHPWDEPFKRLAAASEIRQFRLATPMIGERLHLDDSNQHFSRWWQGVDETVDEMASR